MAARTTDEYGNPTGGQAAPSVGTDEQVRAAFLKYLGREPTGNIWQGDENYESHISGSDEAKQYASRQQQQNNQTQPSGAPVAAAPAASNVKDEFWSEVTQKGRQSLSPQELDGILADPRFAGKIQRLSPDKVSINGEEIDVIGDAGGKNSVAWIDSANRAKMAAGGGGGGGSSYSGSVSGTINGSVGGAQSSDPVAQAVQAAILKQLEGLQKPTDANSNTVQDITNPYHLQSERGLERTRRAIAEAAYARGELNSGGHQIEQQRALEDAGAAEANFTGQTVATQEAQRQSMLMNMLGLGQNATQFSQTLSATQKNFADNLAQQDRHFAATLAQNVAQFGSSMGYQYALLDWSKQQAAFNNATAPVAGV